MTDQGTRQDPLIIRRSDAADLDYASTGVWKIAYADFMTAMMAFFLVMWIVNATGETTKTGIANYFNPIRLSDGAELPRKGLRDPDQVGAESADEDDGAVSVAALSEHISVKRRARDYSGRRAVRHGEEMVFRDPYAVLAAIAAEAPAVVHSAPLGAGDGPVRADSPGAIQDLQGDPFDPPARNAASGTPIAAEKTPATDPGAEDLSLAAGAEITNRNSMNSPPMETRHIGQEASRTRSGPAAGAAGDADPAAQAGAKAKEFATHLAGAARAEGLPEINIRDGDDGVLISLSDHAQFGMFAIGSADPLPETVEVMEKIAELLGDLPGRVIISGHTDGRPFRSGNYDNWQLSAARAQMAYDMLVRGGLDEARVIRIEGHADRELKIPDDPTAAENRRIEILVERVAP